MGSATLQRMPRLFLVVKGPNMPAQENALARLGMTIALIFHLISLRIEGRGKGRLGERLGERLGVQILAQTVKFSLQGFCSNVEEDP